MNKYREEFQSALAEGKVEIVRRLLAAETRLANERLDCGHLPLEIALARESGDLVRCLLEAGGSVHEQEEGHSLSILEGAMSQCLMGDDSSLRLLIESGLPIDERDGSGQTPLMVASRGNLHTVRWLLARGADPNLLAPDGWTALMYACAVSQSFARDDDCVAIVDALVSNGAVIDTKPIGGVTDCRTICEHNSKYVPEVTARVLEILNRC